MKASALLGRHPRVVILCYRFLYGLRAVIPYLLGAGSCRPSLFMILSGVSAAAWAILITSGGYYGGRLFSNALQAGLAIQKWLLLAGGVAVLLVLIGRYLRRGKADR